ncbi:MAG: ATP-binding protein [Saprospiraceae bacterium]|nr:ATP-binding protein [Saprospiraceae bacterium]
MIIRLTIENFLSFNEKTEILLTPGKSRALRGHVVKGNRSRDVDILKSALIYGANASGKSNIVRAVSFLKKLVVKGGRHQQYIDYSKFKLDSAATGRDSQLEVEFHYKGHNYAYGFIFNNHIILQEWLFTFNKERDYKVFERTTVLDEVQISFGKLALAKDELKRLEYIAQDTLPNELFLNSSNHRNIFNIKGIYPITDSYRWFEDALTVVFPDSKLMGMEVNIDSDMEMKEVYQWFLAELKTGISGLETSSVDFFSHDVNLPEAIKRKIVADLKLGERAIITSLDNIRYSLVRLADGSLEAMKLMTRHKIKNEDRYALFEMNEESDGTQRLMDIIPAITELAREEKVFVVDEIDRSLHPNLTFKLFEIFFRESQNIRSQLICTTHESELLNQDLFRKDEIWFVKKNKHGESDTYSLEEFRPRKDKDIRTGYLVGRYNAIPKFSLMEGMPWKTKTTNGQKTKRI